MLVIRGIQCQQKNKALSKEWLEANKKGGYAYSTILFVNTTEYHSLFTITDSLTKKFQLISNIVEKFIINNKLYMPNADDAPSFLEKFYIDTNPHFVYNLNGVKILKSIIMLQYQNTLILKYELLTTTDKLNKVNIEFTPIITGKPITKYLEIKEDFKFQIVKEENYIKYSRDDIPSIYFYFNDLKFVQRNRYIENLNGDAHIIGNFTGEISIENPAYIIISSERLKVLNFEDLYNLEVKNRTELIEKHRIKNELHKNVLLSINSFIIKKDNYEILVAGYPSVDEKPVTTLQCLSGILFPLKKYEAAKDIFKTYLKKDVVFEYYDNNTPLWFIYTVYKFIQHTGDWKFVKDELWTGIREIIEYYYTGGFENIKANADGFLEIIEKNEKFSQAGKPVDLNALWYNVLRITEILAAKFTDIKYHTKSQEISFTIKNNFFKKFWNKDYGYLNNCIDIPPDNSVDTSLRPNQILCISLPFSDILKYKTKLQILNIIKEKLFTFKGIRTLSSENAGYNSSDIYEGALSSFYWGQYITAFLKLNKYSRFAKREAKFFLHRYEKRFKEKIIGYLPEAFTGDPPFAPLGELASAISIAEYVRILYEEFGKF